MMWSAYRSGSLSNDAGNVARASMNPMGLDELEGASRQHVEAKIDTLALVCRAMWTLLQEKTGLTEKELLAQMEKLDLEDGKCDRKRRAKTVKCTRCSRPLTGRHVVCLYCGAPVVLDSAFDAV